MAISQPQLTVVIKTTPSDWRQCGINNNDPFFNSFKKEQYKFLVAAMAPAFVIIFPVIGWHVVSKKGSETVLSGRRFVLMYFIRGGVIYVCRTIEVDFTNIWLFVGLSLFSVVLKFLKKATFRVKIRLWSCIISRLKRIVCCQKLSKMPYDTPHYRGLGADLEIQDMLFD